jgi:hypothetical protein
MKNYPVAKASEVYSFGQNWLGFNLQKLKDALLCELFNHPFTFHIIEGVQADVDLLTSKNEEDLAKPFLEDPDFDGLTYQDVLNAYTTLAAFMGFHNIEDLIVLVE